MTIALPPPQSASSSGFVRRWILTTLVAGVPSGAAYIYGLSIWVIAAYAAAASALIAVSMQRGEA